MFSKLLSYSIIAIAIKVYAFFYIKHYFITFGRSACDFRVKLCFLDLHCCCKS